MCVSFVDCYMFSYSLERTVNQIAWNTDLVTPAANVMTRQAAVEHEMKLVNQAVEQSLCDQVKAIHVSCAVFATSVIM